MSDSDGSDFSGGDPTGSSSANSGDNSGIDFAGGDPTSGRGKSSSKGSSFASDFASQFANSAAEAAKSIAASTAISAITATNPLAGLIASIGYQAYTGLSNGKSGVYNGHLADDPSINISDEGARPQANSGPTFEGPTDKGVTRNLEDKSLLALSGNTYKSGQQLQADYEFAKYRSKEALYGKGK